MADYVPADTFIDGEFVNEAKWYNRVFYKINRLFQYGVFAAGDTGWVTSNCIATTSSCTVNIQTFRKLGNVVVWSFQGTLKVALGTGNIGNVILASWGSDDRFAIDTTQVAYSSTSGSSGGYCAISTSSNGVVVTATGASFASGDGISASGLYIAANADF